ncbi:PP2C family protein-serine/threonine phosphatase [Microterricola pindariensis]|uniref:PP2C family protein-serine/threonine phosphatase n=1 Tax=Microterricola pindariensis TaxID=478010 RepID=UPI001E3E8F34|nr:protein phosphatase 2C domain-containing protein [Microterricola pindariensis]
MAIDQPSPFALPSGTLDLFVEARGDVGAVRKVNEDSLLAAAPVFLVADGMGGHAKGDAASQAVVQVFAEHIAPGVLTTPEQVLDAIHSANDAVRDLSTVGDSGTAVAGTTLTGVALVDAGPDEEGESYRWMVFNVGDSRVYGWDGRVLRQQSVDHSAVQEMVDAGLISAEDAEQHPERNVITRALGAEDSVDVDVWLNQPREYGTYLVCSDGLSKELERSEISAIFARHEAQGDFTGIADELVEAALEAGGSDNVSVVVVRAVTP